MSLIKIITFNNLGDQRGSLVSLEENINIPFDIKRVYYIFDSQDKVARGFHAHKDLKQIAICLKGSCRFIMDNGIEKAEVVLNDPTQGLVIDIMQWHEMYDFSTDCVLVVLANDHYKEDDYIRDYETFKDVINGKASI